MILKIADRLNLARLFPQEGGILTQLTVKDIAKKIEFSQEEIKDIELKQNGQMLRWNPKKEIEIDVEFSSAEMNFLKERVESLDKEQKVTQDMVDLCLLIRNFK
ncbi:MAG: RNA-binding protein [Candidatus Shapirobacteria bacterium]|nr:RNA-binding protein [Candidatus Shapirobacteria bacterium]